MLLVLALLPLAAACATGQKIIPREDAAITKDISAQLGAAPALSDYDLTVETTDAMVTVSGLVRNDADRNTTERIAKATPGVRGVDNRVHYDSSAFDKR